jgi:hypothetical protein
VNDLDLAERAARLLRESHARIAPQRAALPQPTIDLVADTIRRVAARRRRRRLAWSASAAMGLCAGAFALFAAVRARPPASPQVAAAPAPPAESALVARGQQRALVAGDRLRSETGPLELAAADGTSVRMAVGSDLQMLRGDAERWLRLASGAVSVHVTKLKPGQRFVIVTPDAEVEVRGTRFQVQTGDKADACGMVTRVRVDEGIVDVRTGGTLVRVQAGGQWPEGCATAAAPAAPPAPRVAPAVRVKIPRARAVPAAAVVTPAAASEAARLSTLATENDLFSSALRAGQHGDRREAIELLDVLLTRFPGTPLRASALAARDRLSRSLLAGP